MCVPFCRADIDYYFKLTRCGSGPIAVHRSITGCKCRYDLINDYAKQKVELFLCLIKHQD
jgi:hypothetical protein